jgi:NAD+ synthetase
MRIALAQLNPIVGDVDGNARRVLDWIDRAGEQGADLVLFPEMVVTGYPPQDLLERPALAERAGAAVERIAREASGGPAALVGYPERSRLPGTKPYFNAVVLLEAGQVRHTYRKRLLPSYDVFDEDRWFEAGQEPGVMEQGGRRLGMAVCEDIWNHSSLARSPLYSLDPLEDLGRGTVEIILNPSASPFTLGKPGLRERMLAEAARDHGVPVLFVNQVGGNDELVFDGGSLAIGPDGTTRARGPLFEEALILIEVDGSGHVTGPEDAWPVVVEEILERAIVLGLEDFVHKCGFEDVVVGLSGGIDSALVTTLAVQALGPDHVIALAMPSRYSSRGSVRDARALAENLGIPLEEISIEPAFTSLLETLEPHFRGTGFGLAEENLQARIRGTLVMAFANRFDRLALATGNKSELACGYCTLYGDMVGALAPIGDLLKTEVYALARHINSRTPLIPREILDKPPSAELRPDQTDQDTLPPYDTLDRVLASLLGTADLEGDAVPGDPVAPVLSMVRRAEHKRHQAPPVLKVSARAFGPGRRYPIAHGFEE